MILKGGPELRARLKALKVAWKPIGRKWGRASINAGRPMVPERTGRLRKSMRILSNTQTKTRVGAYYTAYFVDKGPRPHDIRPKRAKLLRFTVGKHSGKVKVGGHTFTDRSRKSKGNTIFTRAVHHRGYRARPFRRRMAEEGLRKTPLAQEIIDAWNKAA